MNFSNGMLTSRYTYLSLDITGVQQSTPCASCVTVGVILPCTTSHLITAVTECHDITALN